MPATKELVAHGRSIGEIKDFIGSYELIYQDIEDVIKKSPEKEE